MVQIRLESYGGKTTVSERSRTQPDCRENITETSKLAEPTSIVRLPISTDAEKRFETFLLTPVAKVLGHADRIQPLRIYCKGLLTPGGRKNIEQIAALTASPETLHSMHQSLHHFIATAAWDDDELLRRVHAFVSRQIEAADSASDAWVVTDVGLIKKGKATVGITRKFCERQGRRVNCQSAVMVLASNQHFSLPLCLRLYLPESWAVEPVKRQKGGVPDSIEFATRPEIAIEQIRRAMSLGMPPRLIIANEAYGGDESFRNAISEMGLTYLLRVPSNTSVWSQSSQTSSGVDCDTKTSGPASVKTLAAQLPPTAFERMPPAKNDRGADFACSRVFQQAGKGSGTLQEKWLLVENRSDHQEHSVKYWLSNLPASLTARELADVAMRYWTAEAAYFDLKDHLGLGHYEGRGWRGFHHHATLCIAVYNFLAAEFARTNSCKR